MTSQTELIMTQIQKSKRLQHGKPRLHVIRFLALDYHSRNGFGEVSGVLNMG